MDNMNNVIQLISIYFIKIKVLINILNIVNNISLWND